jgi:glycosyltransferase involved in cell wall biosynthesis
MPVRNEGAFILRSLGAVLAQDYPPALMEVLVADGRSSDGTRERILDWSARDPRVHLVDNAGGIVSTGLNAALRIASGDVVVRVDGHCEIAPDYVRNACAHLTAGAADGVGGPLETRGSTPTARAIAAAMSSPFGVGNSAFRTTSGLTRLTDTVAFPAYRREWMSKAGEFDEELVRNQDDEYNYRLRKLGARILLAADVQAVYYSRSSFRSLWRQYFQYGYWKVRVLQKHPWQMQPRQFVPAVFVTTLLLSAVLTPVSGWAAALLFLVSTAYLGAVGVATLKEARRFDVPRPALALAFVILHLSYGSGFLWGAVRFCNRWFERPARLTRPTGHKEAS